MFLKLRGYVIEVGFRWPDIYIYPLTKNRLIYHARISKQMKWRGSPLRESSSIATRTTHFVGIFSLLSVC